MLHDSLKNKFETLDVLVFLENPDVKHFVGKNFEKFKAQWLEDYSKKKSALRMSGIHFNLAAFLFLPAWLAYRKMWQHYLVLTGLLAATFNLADILHFKILASISGAMVVLSLHANSFYFKHVASYFLKTPKITQNGVETSGGTSFLYGVLGTVTALFAFNLSTISGLLFNF